MSSTPAIPPPANINYLTSLGHSVFLADLVHDACTENWQTGTDEEGNPVWNVRDFWSRRSNSAGAPSTWCCCGRHSITCLSRWWRRWLTHLYSAMNPGGQVLAFFHTRTKGEETVHCRFHVTAGDDVEMQLAQPFPIQRAFTNRSIERLFAGWSGTAVSGQG